MFVYNRNREGGIDNERNTKNENGKAKNTNLSVVDWFVYGWIAGISVGDDVGG